MDRDVKPSGERAMKDATINIVVGLVIATVSSLITVQLSFRRFRSERWWERKAMAYEGVIEALHHSKAFSEAHIDAAILGIELGEDEDQELRQRARVARQEIEEAIDKGIFVMSNRAKDRLIRYKKEVRAASDIHDWFGYLDANLSATNSCLSDLVQLAKVELRT